MVLLWSNMPSMALAPVSLSKPLQKSACLLCQISCIFSCSIMSWQHSEGVSWGSTSPHLSAWCILKILATVEMSYSWSPFLPYSLWSLCAAPKISVQDPRIAIFENIFANIIGSQRVFGLSFLGHISLFFAVKVIKNQLNFSFLTTLLVQPGFSGSSVFLTMSHTRGLVSPFCI